MPTTLVKEVFFRTSTQLHDINPQFVRWTQREKIGYFNDGCKAIAKYLPSSCARVDAFKLEPGTRQFIGLIPAARVRTGDGSTATDVRGNFLQSLTRNMGADGQTPGRVIRIVDREVMDANNPAWHTEEDSVVTAFMYDPRFPKYLYVYPAVPNGQDVWVEGSMLIDPPELAVPGSANYYAANGSATEVIPIDDRYVDELVQYILARCYMKDAEFAGNERQAVIHTNAFVTSINAIGTALNGVNPNLRSLPFSPNVPKQQPAG
ncbi:DUF6682 family protein [Piscinibacter gummiphilus]|uniref:DUF6682 family protein n=1 Tax=Piscinibacter gummiphilus TaxID=946333 RepID=A0ABZ0CNA4_9BURK|nr:DUF6682 family protein [Piscinibacter gummiphilus]WOB06469.1 DUF6682 family protein [Piscinibacter gummiphilus]